ncbi:RsmB/NOP family class I SAM-dependent RNA methyltransferase [Nocardioides sp. CFH 31398]|uniref:RsmB/NOP family class I SAM-dependent RNA methyltransferase n=1 Tax=Nocardioides sp. CFH 31398 TaxID=2919579 RepID=UPI001F065E60|nr:RsmB/NOP family class I SAM-dependent RNA methyltransferase [Nocardioides sp. CFH 31398]MCH1868570.1 RsmB/NOP family class I SAM-dependent RNA methyltransferase [Nocardioides sp. CFH 31398]
MSRPDPSRLAAYEVLKAVRVDDAYANLVLPRVLREAGLSGRDAAFATELAAGTLRGRGTYDAVLDACTDRPLASTPAKVLDALRLGAHQLLAMRVPAHAAISTTVDLVRDRAGAGAGGFANAVLRRVAEHDLAAWLDRLDPAGDDLPLRHSHPAWVVERLGEALAADGADGELPALLAADNAPPAVTLVARPGRLTRADLLAQVEGTATPRSPYGVVLASGDPGAVLAVRDGLAGVQDEGSQLVATALADAPLAGGDHRWLDLCAGPGGKAALLAGLAAGRGAHLVANEVAPHRADLVRRSLAGMPGEPEVTVADGRDGPWEAGSFDRVLLDAPCTGLGALRRRPESRWRRRPSDLDDLVPLQRQLLDSALRLVRPGGVVLYATCSPVLAETRDVVAPYADSPDVAVESTDQLWPHRDGTDAMFTALLRRA